MDSDEDSEEHLMLKRTQGEFGTCRKQNKIRIILRPSKSMLVFIVINVVLCVGLSALLFVKLYYSYVDLGQRSEARFREVEEIMRLQLNTTTSSPEKPDPMWYPFSDTDQRILPQNYTNIIKHQHAVLVHGTPTFWLCQSPKCGTTAWQPFLIWLHDGWLVTRETFAKNPGIVYGHILQMKRFRATNDIPKEELVDYFNRHERYMITRNPYVRFLSSYFDWQTRVKDSPTRIIKDVSFAEFAAMYKKRNFTDIKGTRYDHIDPVSKSCNYVKIDYRVLRLEEESLWFEPLMKRYNLLDKLEEFVSIGGPSPFQSGVTSESKLFEFLPSVLGLEMYPRSLAKDPHVRNSINKLGEHYTPELASLVSEVMKEDFVNFGYPIWDGHIDNFRLV